MAFWDDVGRNVGNFFGSLTGQNPKKKKKDEEYRRNRSTPNQNVPLNQNQQQPFDQSLQPKGPVNIFEDLNKNLMLGQNRPGVVSVVNNQTPKSPQVTKPLPEPVQPPKPTVKPPNDNPFILKRNISVPQRPVSSPKSNPAKDIFNFGKTIISGLQQAGGNIADKAVMGGAVLDDIRGAVLGKSSAQRAQTAQEYEKLRNMIKQGKTVDDESLNPNKDFKFTGNPSRDISNLAGRGLQTGFDATMFVNPGRLAAGGAKGLTKRELGKFAARDAAFFGTGAGTSTGLQKYAETGDLEKAIKEGVKSGAISAVTQGGLDVTGGVIGKSKLLENAPFNKTLKKSVGIGKTGINRANVPIKKDIAVDEVIGDSLDIPVSVNTVKKPEGPMIREIGGDAQNIGQNAANAVEVPVSRETPIYRPDPRIEGITPTNTGNTGLFTRAEINNERAAIDDALANKELTPAEHAVVSKELDTLSAVDDGPRGQKIEVKEVTGIPVIDQTTMATGSPEIPGTVRVTTQNSPMQAETQAIANAPVVSSPTTLSKEVQAVLDNPKQFNKRQVESARNQRKLAKQMAKTQEDTAEALSRIETASPAAQSGEGFVPTGEFAKSVNGGPIQKASRQAEMQQAVQETSQMSPVDVLQTARQNQAGTGGFNRRDIRNIAALIETKRIPRGTPEWQEARTILKEDGTVWGQTGALRNYSMRRNASADELVSRYESKIYRLADDPTKIESKWFDQVEAAENAYVVARDDATATFNEFTQNPTSANAARYHAAQDAAEKADKAAKEVEYSVATKALKGNKDVKQVRELEKMANDADMYQMDAVDASMLSGTGTFVRNFVNSAIGGVEEGLFGKVASRIAGKVTGRNVGGGAGRGTISGFGEGAKNLVDVSKARAANAGKNPLEHAKNWATTGNQLGDTVIDSQTKHNVIDHYTQLLKDQGYSGRELTDRASVMARQDPDNLAREYAGTARVAAGLGSGITRNNKVETLVKNVVSDSISGGNPSPLTEATGKLVARMTIGFPTAIGRSTVEGVKRFTLGAPTFIKAMRQTDPVKRSILVKEGIKQAGTGAFVVPPLFYALGAADMISGAYPADKETRAQWEREGKTENSIKIDGAWYQLPAYLGAWAVPGLFYASLGRSGGDFTEATADTAKAIPALLPTDQASNILDVVNGRTDLGKFMAQSGAATVRAATPAGALLNQISRSFDPTKNDTSSGTTIENFVDKVLSGIPGVNNMADIPDKVSDTGASITNPNPLELLAGAASDVQGGGEARSAEIQQESNNKLQVFSDNGLLDDPNLKEVLEGKEKAIYNKIKSGKELKEGELEDLQKAFVKGVSSTGDDTAYLEREQYDSNLRALQLKKQLMEADKTVKPSDISKVDMAITRGEVYKANEIPYDLISEYQGTGVAEWRKMGDPESDDYDPDMYQKLFEVDDALTQKGVSYKKGSPDKHKYTAKTSKSKSGSGGRGGSSSSQVDTDFGKLKDGMFAPRVQQYDTIETKSGSVPIIRRVRPNIVHKIGSSG